MSNWIKSEWTADIRRKTASQLRGFFVHESKILAGYAIYHGGSVEKAEWSGSSIFTAEVHDGNIWTTSVQFDFLPFSRCQCQAKGSCLHMVAAVFAAMKASRLDVDAFIEEDLLRENADFRALKKKISPAAAIKSEGMKRSAVNVNADGLPSLSAGSEKAAAPRAAGNGANTAADSSYLPASTDASQQWHEKLARLFPWDYSSPLIYSSIIESRWLALANNWPDRKLAALFRAHALLLAMKQSEEHHGRSYFHGCEVIREELTALFGKQVQALLDEEHGARSAANQQLRGLLEVIVDYGMKHGETNFNWLHLFRFISNQLRMDREGLDRQRNQLVRKLRRAIGANQTSIIHLSIAHLHLLLDNDQAALAYLDGHEGEINVYQCFEYLHVYETNKQWAQLKLWLDWFKPWLVDEDGYGLESYLDYWDSWFVGNGGHRLHETEQRAMYAELLPASYERYSNFLLKNKDYKRWIDLHYYLEISPMESESFHAVYKQAPQVLLPYYHQMTERWIAKRDREGYQLAVKWMRQLREIYTRLKRKDQWETYVIRLIKRYSRLRALQEEMRKGGLSS